MVSLRCKMVVRDALTKMGLHYAVLDLGVVEIIEDISPEQRAQLRTELIKTGLLVLDSKTAILVDRIVTVIVELVHYSEEVPRVNYSDFITEKLGFDYTYLSNVFSEVKGMTIQQFIILHKIERVKELLLYDELNLKEISYKLHYSSVAHLSTQFKKVTGLSPSYFKHLKQLRSIHLEDL
jgi:AraC-like DNA-binding protein